MEPPFLYLNWRRCYGAEIITTHLLLHNSFWFDDYNRAYIRLFPFSLIFMLLEENITRKLITVAMIEREINTKLNLFELHYHFHAPAMPDAFIGN